MRRYLVRLAHLWNRGRLQRLGLSVAGLVVGLVIINLVTAAVYAGRAYPNTHFASLPSTVVLQASGQDIKFTTRELGITRDDSKIASAARDHSWLPVWNFFIAHNVPAYTKINQPLLERKLTEVATQQKQNPVDARIVIQDSQFTLSESSVGRQLDVAKAAREITGSLGQGKSTIKLPMVRVAPAVTDASLEAQLQQFKAQQAVALSFIYNGKVSKPSAATIVSWYAAVNGSFALQDIAIQNYIMQAGRASNIRVQNLAQAVTATKQAIQTTQALNFTLVAAPPGPCSGNTISKLILVNLSQQHLWACEADLQVYDTAITSGANQVNDQGTPTGSWKIYGKSTNRYLSGPTWNDFVNYWMPYYADFGFHDAPWQTIPFGDPSYPTQGSHGCVRLPTGAMAWLYGWAPVGTTVTVTN